MRSHHPLTRLATNIDDTKNHRKSDYVRGNRRAYFSIIQKAATFRYAEFDGEVVDVDGKVFKVKVRIISDYPEMVDL
jgi:hypothetical protein